MTVAINPNPAASKAVLAASMRTGKETLAGLSVGQCQTSNKGTIKTPPSSIPINTLMNTLMFFFCGA
jgi:hypothetical protein